MITNSTEQDQLSVSGEQAEDEKGDNSVQESFSIVKYSSELYEKWMTFHLRDKLESLRVKANQQLVRFDAVLNNVKSVASKPVDFKDDLLLQTYKFSAKLNTQYPYAASMCRSHEELVIASSMLFIAIPAWRLPRKAFLASALGTYIVSQATCCTFNFKWNVPMEVKISK